MLVNLLTVEVLILSKVLAIGQELEERDSRLFTVEQHDIDEILSEKSENS